MSSEPDSPPPTMRTARRASQKNGDVNDISTTRRGTPFKKQEKPEGSRSRWSTASNLERLFWLISVPLRTILCFTNITVFLLAYFGFMIPVLWLKPLIPRFYWFYEGKFYMWLVGR